MLCVEMMLGGFELLFVCVWVWIGSFCRSKKKKRDSVVGRSLVIIVIFVGGFSLSLSLSLIISFFSRIMTSKRSFVFFQFRFPIFKF